MKKVILFIVEGITEERSLGGILNQILKRNHTVKFQIVHGDITSDESSTVDNVEMKLLEQVEAKCRIEGLWKNDILKVVHLVDMDGAYIQETFIMEEDIEHVLYTEEVLKTRFVEKLQERNRRKSAVLDELSRQNFLEEIPYQIYYFSCNLEHVLHGIQNVPEENKVRLAEKFSEDFYKKDNEFIQFLHSKEFMVKGDYVSTWQYIKEEKNSLHRHCNFHLFFDEDKIENL